MLVWPSFLLDADATSAGRVSLPSGFTPPCSGPLCQIADDPTRGGVLGKLPLERALPWSVCDGGLRGSGGPHPRVVIWVRQPRPRWPLVPCGSLTWPREAGTSERGALDLRTAGTLAKSPRRLSWLEPKPASQRAAPSRDVWETPLTNGFVQRPGGLWTQPQGSSLATSLGPRMQGHLAGSEPAPGPHIPAWRPQGPPPCAATAHRRQPQPSGASVHLGWGGLGFPGGNLETRVKTKRRTTTCSGAARLRRAT